MTSERRPSRLGFLYHSKTDAKGNSTSRPRQPRGFEGWDYCTSIIQIPPCGGQEERSRQQELLTKPGFQLTKPGFLYCVVQRTLLAKR
jgi:hypothetical protein